MLKIIIIIIYISHLHNDWVTLSIRIQNIRGIMLI